MARTCQPKELRLTVPNTWVGRVAAGKDRIMMVVLGAVMATGLAPLSLGPLAFCAVMGILLLTETTTTVRSAALLGWLAGLGYFGVGLHWIVEPFFVDAAETGWMAPFALIAMSGGLALFWGAAFGLARVFGGGVWRFALMWAAFEIARGFVFSGFPWALVSHIWSGGVVLQWSAFLGSYGLTLLTLVLAAVPVWLWQTWRRPVIALVLAAGALGALFGVGIWQGAQEMPQVSQDAPVIRLVQPNAPQHEKWDPEKIPVFFNRMVRFSAAEPAPDLVVWPESALAMLLNEADQALSYIAEQSRAPLVIGVQRQAEETVYHNSLALIDETGAVQDVYDKHHLVPFGEYMPVPSFWRSLGIRSLAVRVLYGYTPGPGPRMLDLPGIGKALPLICYEAVFPRHTRLPGERADVMLQLTNDAWFGAAVGPWQHLEQAKMRAIEQGVPMVRVANTGISGVIDAKGRLTAHLPLGEAGFLDVSVPPALPPTLYARLGDVPTFVALALLLSISVVTGLRTRIDLMRSRA